MTGTLRVRRSRGALSGMLLVLLGLWGALIPFAGPYFHYAYQPDRAWAVTSGRIWLEVLPGAVTLAGGLVVLVSRFRPAVLLGAWLAALGGAWFAVAGLIGGHVAGIPAAGTPAGDSTRAVLEQLGFFTGLGVVIVFLGAVALGRFSVVAARDAAALETAGEAGAGPAGGPVADSEPEPGRTARRLPMVTPVPVFRSRQRTAEGSEDDTGRRPIAGRTS